MQIKLDERQLFILDRALNSYYWDFHKTDFDQYTFTECDISELKKYIRTKLDEREIKTITKDEY